jgi:hypothetical protein
MSAAERLRFRSPFRTDCHTLSHRATGALDPRALLRPTVGDTIGGWGLASFGLEIDDPFGETLYTAC